MRGSMSPGRGSDSKRGLTFESRAADKAGMGSSWNPEGAAHARRSRERGQALVEFALIAPLFLLIVVGIIQFGIGLNYWLDLNRIANQGARWAVVNKYPGCDGTPSAPGCVSPTLKAHLESQAVSGGLNPVVSICFEGNTGTVGMPVTVRATHSFNFLAIMDLAPITLRGKATMRIEQPPTVLQAQGVGKCAGT
jgi:TadE-like protein